MGRGDELLGGSPEVCEGPNLSVSPPEPVTVGLSHSGRVDDYEVVLYSR